MRTVEKLRDDLHAAVDDGPVPPADVPGLVRGARRRRRRRRIGGAVAVLAALAVLSAGGALALPRLSGGEGSVRVRPAGPPTAVVPPGMKPVISGKPQPLESVTNLQTERGAKLRVLTGSAAKPAAEFAGGLWLCLVGGRDWHAHSAYPGIVLSGDVCDGPQSAEDMKVNPGGRDFPRNGLEFVFYDGGADPFHGTEPDLILGVTRKTVDSGLISNSKGEAAVHTVRIGGKYTVFWAYLPKAHDPADSSGRSVYPSLSIQLYQQDRPLGGCGPRTHGVKFCIGAG